MRVTAPVTDYMKRSLLTAIGDLVVGDPLEHDRLPAGTAAFFLMSGGVALKPIWKQIFEVGSAVGDLWVRNTLSANRFPAGASGTFLKGKGAGVLPAYEVFDGADGSFLKGKGTGVNPAFEKLDGTLKLYLKALGAGNNPAFSTLRLDDVGIKISNSIRNSSGDQVISGIGFQPSVVIFFATDGVATKKNMSWGFSNLTVNMCIVQTEDDTRVGVDNTGCIAIDRVGLNFIRAVISAWGADGFTLNWAKVGTCSCGFIYLCLP